ncbi:MAG: hypothetical protein SFY69_09795 [Planctomycetota bacterium]|nr:hypothetical protein [Planctomycetota bacterium]
MRTRPSDIVTVSLLLACGGTASASVIDSAAYFTSVPHTRITWEADGAGSPVALMQGASQVMPTNAYSTLGLMFETQVRWINDGTGAFDAAQATGGGSPANAIPSSLVNTFAFTFTVPVRSFGFWLANNRGADPAGPTIQAFDAQGQLIESVQFGGSLVDGSITVGQTTADYGFMGIESQADIARVVVTKQAAIFDDLYFSVVPAPASAGVLALGLLAAGRRRR